MAVSVNGREICGGEASCATTRASGKASRVSGVSFHVSLARDFLLAGSLREALCISLLVSYKYADTSLCSSVVRSGRKT